MCSRSSSVRCSFLLRLRRPSCSSSTHTLRSRLFNNVHISPSLVVYELPLQAQATHRYHAMIAFELVHIFDATHRVPREIRHVQPRRNQTRTYHVTFEGVPTLTTVTTVYLSVPTVRVGSRVQQTLNAALGTSHATVLEPALPHGEGLTRSALTLFGTQVNRECVIR